MPRTLPPDRQSWRRRFPAGRIGLLVVSLVMSVAAGLAGGGCDEKLQNFLKNASDRQAARDKKAADAAALRARGLGPADPISPEIARAIEVVRISDYDFVVIKPRPRKAKNRNDDPPRRRNGFDFAATLESKTKWLGRGVNDLSTWLDEIGSSTFFSGDAYGVQLPDGRTLSFRFWLLEELAALPPPLEDPPT